MANSLFRSPTDDTGVGRYCHTLELLPPSSHDLHGGQATVTCPEHIPVCGAVPDSSQGYRLTGASQRRAPLILPDVPRGLHGRHTRLELSINPRHQQVDVLLWQNEMNRRGHCTGRCGVRRLERDRRQVRAVPHHPVVWPRNSAWQSPQPLYYPVQRVLVDQM